MMHLNYKTARLTNKLTPIVFMGYMNTFESLGADLYAKCSSSELDGILIVDMPPEESSEFSLAAKRPI